jgi:uncharacterized iron-regulated protein
VKRFLLPLFILFVCQWVFVDSGLSDESKVLRVRDGKIITFAGMIADVKKADFVFIGEVHDISEHHRDELAIIRAFHESDAPTAVGLEMFRADSQGVLDSWTKGKLSLEQFLSCTITGRAWPLYRDIFQYARDHEIPLLGLNVPTDRQKWRTRFCHSRRRGKKTAAPGISCNVDPTYMEFIRRAYAGRRRMIAV